MDKVYLKAFDKRFKICEEHSELEILGANDHIVLYKGDDKEGYKKIQDIDLDESLHIPLLEIFSSFFFFMENGKELDKFLPSFLWPRKNEIRKEITFFGGSFNPWHEGHSECLRQCLMHESNIVIIPDHSPWKENIARSPFEQILEISKITHKKHIIYPGFWLSEKRNPTSEWITKVKCEKKNWLMGDDTFISLMKWHRVDVFLESINRLYVVPRILSPNDSKLSELIGLLVSKVDLVFLEPHEFQEISSTNLREEIS